jgi:hypothetical protein
LHVYFLKTIFERASNIQRIYYISTYILGRDIGAS